MDYVQGVAQMPDKLCAAAINVAAECPRGLQGSAHIYDYTHRQNMDPVEEPNARVWCVGPNCPREFKELYPWHTKSMSQLLEANIEYIAERKKVT